MLAYIIGLSVCSVISLVLTLNLADVPCGNSTDFPVPHRRPFVAINNSLFRIVGGQEAVEGQYPWTTLLEFDGQPWCGATIINRFYALTASHCIRWRSARRFRLVVAQHRLNARDQYQFEVGVQAVALHPDYRSSSYRHDIAVVRLAAPLQWSPQVQPVCLPDPDSSPGFAGRTGSVAGWGWLAEPGSGGSRASALQHVRVPIMDHVQCSVWFEAAGKKTAIRPGQICAGHVMGGRDSCQGDSGGPLVVDDKGVAVLAGIVSAGIGCGRPSLPGVYTDVRVYVPWISSKVT